MLQTSIWSNRAKTVFLVILFPCVLWLVITLVFTFLQYKDTSIWQSSWNDGLMMTNGIFVYLLPIIFVWGVISFLWHRQLIFLFSGAKPLERKDNPDIYNIVENLCISRGLQTPRIGILEDDSMNAFATGRNAKHGRIVFSRGLINKLNKQEIEAVAAHELTHIINQDSLLMIIIVIFVGIIGTLGQILIRVRSKKGNIIPIIGIAFLILGYCLYPFIQLAISRKREYLADAGSVELTKDNLAMISALQKISQDPVIESIKKDTIAAMCIESPFAGKKSFFSNLLSTHPSIEDRIKALQNY